jgi:hypothetical protein
MNSQPIAPMPEIDAGRLCTNARYRLRENGDVIDQANNVWLGNAAGSALLGFKRASSPPKTKWTYEGVGGVEGSFCFEGNVEIGSTVGTVANPMRWSIYATGSVTISGNPILRSFDEDSILVAAGGDLQVSGNPASGAANAYSGAMYARHQCEISGTPDINGQVICDNEPGQDLTRTEDYAVQNVISGAPTLSYGCNNKYASTRRHVGWMLRQGTP